MDVLYDAIEDEDSIQLRIDFINISKQVETNIKNALKIKQEVMEYMSYFKKEIKSTPLFDDKNLRKIYLKYLDNLNQRANEIYEMYSDIAKLRSNIIKLRAENL